MPAITEDSCELIHVKQILPCLESTRKIPAMTSKKTPKETKNEKSSV